MQIIHLGKNIELLSIKYIWLIRKSGVMSSAKQQTSIRIKCGKIGTDVKVSYREFYNQLELCKLALQDYKYEIEII
jgi:hypothetical protein